MAIEYLKEKILNDVKQQFSPSNQEDKINAELVESVRKQMEGLQSEISFLRKEMKGKNTLLKIIIHLKGSPKNWLFLPQFTYSTRVIMLPKMHLFSNKIGQNHLKNNLPMNEWMNEWMDEWMSIFTLRMKIKINVQYYYCK